VGQPGVAALLIDFVEKFAQHSSRQSNPASAGGQQTQTYPFAVL
jgi:hypothetical protein